MFHIEGLRCLSSVVGKPRFEAILRHSGIWGWGSRKATEYKGGRKEGLRKTCFDGFGFLGDDGCGMGEWGQSIVPCYSPTWDRCKLAVNQIPTCCESRTRQNKETPLKHQSTQPAAVPTLDQVAVCTASRPRSENFSTKCSEQSSRRSLPTSPKKTHQKVSLRSGIKTR